MNEKSCIACAEDIKAGATLCRFCGIRQDDPNYLKGNNPEDEAIQTALNFIDLGNFDAAKNIFYDLVDKGYFPALVGLSEIGKITKDKVGILNCLKLATKNGDWLSGMGICMDLLDLHQESYSLDPRIKTYEEIIEWRNEKSEYIHRLYSCLLAIPPEMKSRFEEQFVDAAATVSSYADIFAFKSDVKVAEMQVKSSTWLMESSSDEFRKLGAKNLYFFFKLTPPDQIGALFTLHGLNENLGVIEDELEFYISCEKNREVAITALISQDPLPLLMTMDKMYDEDSKKRDLFGMYVGHSTILHYLVHEVNDVENSQMKKLKDKYWV